MRSLIATGKSPLGLWLSRPADSVWLMDTSIPPTASLSMADTVVPGGEDSASTQIIEDGDILDPEDGGSAGGQTFFGIPTTPDKE